MAVETMKVFGRDTDRGFIDALMDSFEADSDGNVQFSIGISRGATRAEMSAGQFHDLVDVLGDWKPTEQPEIADEPAIVAKHTIALIKDDDGSEWVSFKTSNQKNARTAKVPKDTWKEFVNTLRQADKTLQEALAEAGGVEESAQPATQG